MYQEWLKKKKSEDVQKKKEERVYTVLSQFSVEEKLARLCLLFGK